MAMVRPLVILQIEDAPSDAQLTAYALKVGDIPHSLHVVTDGALAVEFLKHTGSYRESPRPDLILLDLDLPKLDGNQVLEFIKADESLMTIPVIIFSSSEGAECKRRAYALHANSYVVKPLDMSAFAKKVRAIAEYWYATSELDQEAA